MSHVIWVAIAAGVVLGAPSPYSLAAVGLMVRNGYRLPVQGCFVFLWAQHALPGRRLQ